MNPRLNERSQVTIFIIIGVVLVLVAVSGFIIISSLSKSSASGLISTKDKIDQGSLTSNLQSCLAKTEPIVNAIIKNGGRIDFIDQPVLFNGIKYRYWCKTSSLDPRGGCANLVFTKKGFEDEMSAKVKDSFEDCINLSFYEDIGYKVETEDSTVEVLIGALDVQLNVRKRIQMTKAGQDIKLDQISRTLKIPAGRMIDLANDILNQEIATGNFDKDAWMRSNGAEIEIEKHKPYPDTVYHMLRHNIDTDTWTELNFAIGGIDTVKDITEDYTFAPSKWCKAGNYCFFNPETHSCPTSIVNNKPAGCENSSMENHAICGLPGLPACGNCGKYKSGEEWCEYDSTPGLGYDFVGTRHYKKSCIDGEIYTEECRDYREEICVHKGSGVSSDAMCRPNRWKTCMGQQSQSACNDNTKRDCFWFNDYLASSGTFSKSRYPGDVAVSCFPQVPPGFKFWQLSGIESCNLGNEWIDCDGVTCPKVWSQASMLSCMRLGDCGKKYTYSGVFGSVSFKTTDLFKQPEYLSNLKIPGLPNLGNAFMFDLQPYNFSYEKYSANSFACTDCTINQMLDRADEYLDYLEGLDTEDMMWDYIWDGEVSYHTRHFSVCMPFVLDEESNCKKCEDPIIPCTEYKCRSTGSNCRFFVDPLGYGRCTNRSLSVDSPEIISSTVRGSPYNTFAPDTFATTIVGKKIVSDVDVFTVLNISFNTTKPAICRQGLLPLAFTDLPLSFNPRTLRQGESNFSFEHTMAVFTIPNEYMRETVADVVTFGAYMDMLDPDSILAKIDQLEAKAEGIVEDAGEDPSLIRNRFMPLRDEYINTVKPSIDDFYLTYRNYITKLLYNADHRTNAIFFNCMDEHGANNKIEFFVSYKMKEDMVSPRIISSPDDVVSTIYESNLSFSIGTDEPAVCRMSFTDETFQAMPYPLSCTKDFFSSDGEFPCTALIEKSKNPAYLTPSMTKSVYVRCRDKPFIDDIALANVNQYSKEIEYN